MNGGRRSYVLDCFALYAYFQAGPGGERVKKLVEDALRNKVTLYFSLINLGELYYITYKKLNEGIAKSIISDVNSLPINIQSITDAQVWNAAELKAHFNISYADAFAASLAQSLNATIVTGDPEFMNMTKEINVLWILD